MNNNLKYVIIILSVVIIIGGVGYGVYSFGNKTNTTTNSNQNQQLQQDRNGQENFGSSAPNGQGNMRGGPGMDFNQFVEDGIINQATADKMKEYMEEQIKNMQKNRQNGTPGERPNLFAGMVSKGIITQEQADKIEKAMPGMGAGNGQGMPSGGFGGN